MNAPTVLSPMLLARLAGTAPTRSGPAFLRTGLVRAGLLLAPVPLALAGTGQLAAAPPAAPVGAIVTGWTAVAFLTRLGQVAASRGAARPAVARLVLAGFAIVMAGWTVLLAVAPGLAGDDLTLAYAASLPALAMLGSLAVAMATRAEATLLAWTVPAVLVSGAVLSGWLPAAGLLLLAALAAPVARASALAFGRSLPGRPRRASASLIGLTPTDVASAGRYLALGLAQAALVAATWRAGATALPVALLLVAAVPLMEVWIGWQLARTVAGRVTFEHREPYLKHLRRLVWATLAPLLPLLVGGVALAASAHRLPYGLSTHPDAPAVVLSIAAGVLLPGVLALGALLAARGLATLAALVTATPLAVAAVLGGTLGGAPGPGAASLSGWGQPLPATIAALAVGFAAGLILTAYVLADPRRRP